MAQKNNISQELIDLGSSLADTQAQNPYSVPAGYFEGLADQVLRRIKAEAADNAEDELNLLSPVLSKLTKGNIYTVPDNYFAELEEKLLAGVNDQANYENSQEELAALSPLLGNLSRKMPYAVPTGYFENLHPNIEQKAAAKTQTKVVSISSRRRWMQYAAAAVITGIIALSGFLYFNQPASIDPIKEPHAWLEKNVKKVSTADIDSFITLVDEGLIASSKPADKNIKPADKSVEINELMKDISDNEIQNFLNETYEPTESGDETLLN